MIQRFLQTALTRGIQTFLSDPTLFQSLFGKIWYLSTGEVDAIRVFFQANPPVFYQGYPRAALDNRPSGFITCTGESQPDFALNDYTGSAPALGPQGQEVPGASGQGSYWNHQYSIFLVTRGQPEKTLWFYEMCKSSLAAAKQYFLNKSVYNYSMSGSDVAPDAAYMPETLFARTLNFRCQRVFLHIDSNSTLSRAFAVDGLVAPPLAEPLAGRPQSGIRVAVPASSERSPE